MVDSECAIRALGVLADGLTSGVALDAVVAPDVDPAVVAPEVKPAVAPDGDAFAVEFMNETNNWLVDLSDLNPPALSSSHTITDSNSTMTFLDNPAVLSTGNGGAAPMFGSGAGPGFFDRIGGSGGGSGSGTGANATSSASAGKGVGSFFSKVGSSMVKKPIVPGTLGLGNLYVSP